MSSEYQQILDGIAALEAQRALLGDALVDGPIAALHSKLLGLTATPAADSFQALRQVSILFLDIVGSTALSQHLDPEDVHVVMDGALSRCTKIVEAHHGKALQYAGDSLLAAFGAVEVKEDDAERAVHCGLALLTEGRRLAAEVQDAHGHADFNVRVGIHTGRVLLGGGVDAEGTIRGIAVSIAARMEQTAPAGRLRISHDTYAQVRGIFDVEPQDPMVVKGVDAPIRSYLVQRAKPSALRVVTHGIEGVTTGMIGRDAQLQALRVAFKRTCADRSLIVVTVVAEAGLGKTRLLNEFEKWTKAHPEAHHTFLGRANPMSHGQPYGLLRGVISRHLAITDDDTLPLARRKIESGIMPLLSHEHGDELAEAHAHLLGHLIGVDFSDSRHLRGIEEDPEKVRDRAFHAAAQMFRRLSASDDSPILLQLEDLHWADDGSLSFLNYLVQVNGDVPMLILSSTRPTLFERRINWHNVERVHQRIDLVPLDKSQSSELALELLNRFREVPAALVELVTRDAEGNPFYMEELVSMLVDDSVIEVHADRWRLNSDKLLAKHVPSTLTGVLQARLDSLPATEKLILQQASVIGYTFWDKALEALDERAQRVLPSLVWRELALLRADATLEGTREYTFRHHLLHSVTYDTVLKRTRQELHGKVANWLAGLTGLRAKDFLEATARHYEKAGYDAQAAEFYARAAEFAKERFASTAALAHADRALSILDVLAESRPRGDSADPDANLMLRWRLIMVREQVHDLLGQRDPQRSDVDLLERLADTLADDRLRAVAAWRRGHLAFYADDFRAGERSARRAIVLAERAGDDVLRLRAQSTLAISLANLGDFETAQEVARHGLDEARICGARDAEAKMLSTVSYVAFSRGDNRISFDTGLQALQIYRELGDSGRVANTVGNLGINWLEFGELEKARRDLEEALRLNRAIGDHGAECVWLCFLSSLALRQGHVGQAQIQARSALDIAAAADSRYWQAAALHHLGNAELALRNHAAALEAFDRSHALGQTINDELGFDGKAGLARVLLAQGDVTGALQQVDGLLAYIEGGGSLVRTHNPALVEITCAQVLARANDLRAGAMLERIHGNLHARAAKIVDSSLRQSYLNNISEHRDVAAAWAAWQGTFAAAKTGPGSA